MKGLTPIISGTEKYAIKMRIKITTHIDSSLSQNPHKKVER